MPVIHPSALVEAGAELDADVEIGPYSIIGAQVRIGAGTRIGPHVCVQGRTRIGRDNRIHAFCSIGAVPQDKKYAGEPTALEIGDRNTIREYCSVNLGTVQDGGLTRIGHDNWIMAYVHVAHDCRVGDNTVLANCTQLAGHVHVGDWAILGGLTGVHQFVHVGAHAMTGVGSAVTQDVPTYVMLAGTPARPHGINAEGLRRRGFDAGRIAVLREAYRLLYRRGLALDAALHAVQALHGAHPQSGADLALLVDFVAASSRGIVRP